MGPLRCDALIPQRVLSRLQAVKAELGGEPGWLCPAGRLTESLLSGGHLEGVCIAGLADGDSALVGLSLEKISIQAYEAIPVSAPFVLIASTEQHKIIQEFLQKILGPTTRIIDLCDEFSALDPNSKALTQEELALRVEAFAKRLTPLGGHAVNYAPLDDWCFRPTGRREETTDCNLPMGPSPDLSKARRILWMQPHGLGDLVLAGDAPRILSEAYPQARIDVLLREQGSGVYDACPYVHKVIRFESMMAERNSNYLEEVLALLQNQHYDAVLNPLFLRRPLWDLCALATEAPIRVALGGGECLQPVEFRNLLRQAYTHILPSSSGLRPSLSRTRDFLLGLGISTPLQPRVWLDPAAGRSIDSRIETLVSSSNRLIMLFASAYEDWRSNASLGEALALVLDPKSDVLIACGERRHRAFHQAQLDVFKGRSFNFCGELSLQESMALIARAQLVVGVDSGPCHVAGALDIPHCVVVGGGHFGVFYPWHPETTLVLNPLTCFGCQWKCPYPRRHCLDGIEPAMIAEGIRNALHTQRKRNSSRSLVLCVDPANQPIPSLDLALHVNPERVQVMKIEYPSFENRNSNAGAHA